MRLPGSMIVCAVLVLLVGCTSPDTADDDSDGELQLGWAKVEDGPRVELPSDPTLVGTVPQVDPGQPVLLNFWASWCAPCRKELPMLERLQSTGVLVVGINRDRYAKYARSALDRYEVTYPNWADPYVSYSASFNDVIPMNALPSSLVIVDGVVTEVHIGAFDSWSDLQEHFARRS